MSNELCDLLTGLGDTSQEVAKTLEAKGITGRPVSASSCPVSNYVKAEFPECTYAVTSSCSATAYADGPRFLDSCSDVPLPVADFIREFDLSKHKNLITGYVELPWYKKLLGRGRKWL